MNAWSLLYDILNGTFDEEYPIVGKKEVDEKTGLWKEPDPVEHSDYYYAVSYTHLTLPTNREV